MIRAADRLARAGMLTGLALMLQPWWQAAFRWGFLATACFTLMHIVTSHLSAERG